MPINDFKASPEHFEARMIRLVAELMGTEEDDQVDSSVILPYIMIDGILLPPDHDYGNGIKAFLSEEAFDQVDSSVPLRDASASCC